MADQSFSNIELNRNTHRIRPIQKIIEQKITYVMAEYIWIDRKYNLRSKVKTVYLDDEVINIGLGKFPEWNFDGSSTGQARGKNTEIILKPVRIYYDPWVSAKYLVLCECLDQNRKPCKTNNRDYAVSIFKKCKDYQAQFGLEQEYVIYDKQTGNPVGWDRQQTANSPHYCGIGSRSIQCRHIAEEHYDICLNILGLPLTGMNAEVMPGQWEFQIRSVGIDASDSLWMARYILEKLCEKYNYYVSYNPKPKSGHNGSGCHINFSTAQSRGEGGIKYIHEYIKNLERGHREIMKHYGPGNNQRLTGKHETSNFEEFTWGVGTRHTSVRIPNDVMKNKCGYLEDRRPAANIDPYHATSLLLKTGTCVPL